MLPFFMILPGADRTQGFDCGFDPNGLWSCALTPGGQGGVHGSGPKSNQEAVLSQVQRSWFCKLFPIWTDTDGGLLSRDFNLPDLIRSLACTSAKPYTSLWPARKMANESSEFSSTMQKGYRKYTYIYIYARPPPKKKPMFSHCDEGDRTTETCACNFKCWKYSTDGSAQARVILVKGWLIGNIKLSSKGENDNKWVFLGISFGHAKLKSFDLSEFDIMVFHEIYFRNLISNGG